MQARQRVTQMNPREIASFCFLSDRPRQGIEIGALHNPLPVPPTAKVTYVDRWPTEELRSKYTVEESAQLVHVEIIDNGETLSKIPDGSQDFVISNHMLEHAPNPLQALENMIRTLAPDGILYLTIPDKRFTFDVNRPVTSFEHVVRDYEEGPEWSRRDHIEESLRLNTIAPITDEEELQRRIEKEMAQPISGFHHHVWSEKEYIEFLSKARDYLNLDISIEMIWRSGIEIISILRKSGKPQVPSSPLRLVKNENPEPSPPEETIFQNNLQALNETNPPVAEWIKNVDISEHAHKYKVTSQAAFAGSLSLHDETDPKNEGQRLAQDWLSRLAPQQAVCVLGFGLGFHLEALLEQMETDQQLEVQLVDRNLFKLCLMNRDLSHILKDKRLKFVSYLTPQNAFMLPSLERRH